MNQLARQRSGTAAGGGSIRVNQSFTTTSGTTFTTDLTGSTRDPQYGKRVANAVYGYVQAIRALGRGTATSGEISSALNIPESEVIDALVTLQSKGVKINK